MASNSPGSPMESDPRSPRAGSSANPLPSDDSPPSPERFPSSEPSPRRGLLSRIGPGLLVAATGVGAGDLATGAFTGSKLGLTVLWAVLLGAVLKYALNEGLARWQLATGSTLLEGVLGRVPGRIRWLLLLGFLPYLLVWSFFTAAALMSAVGATAHAILPWFAASTDKIVYGLLHSFLAVALVLLGGYRLFEKVMSVCIAAMFVIVLATAIAVQPDPAALARGICWPTFPADASALNWTIALIGGVGGTVTILCYGYWIREEGRAGLQELATSRIDLATGYVMTAAFGLAMVVIGSEVGELPKAKSASLILELAQRLEAILGAAGPLMRWAFLLGAWGAVFSSLLGVWQSIPYLFADICQMARHGGARPEPVSTSGIAYRGFLFAQATIPALALAFSFESIQLVYAIVGAMFVPLLASVLLLVNRRRLVGREAANGWLATSVLLACLGFFAYYGWISLAGG